MKHQATAGATENGPAGENLSAEGRRLSISRQSGCALELGQEIEDQQHGAERRLGSEELLQAESIGSEIVLYRTLYLGDQILDIRSSVVIAPDFLGGLRLAGHEKCERYNRASRSVCGPHWSAIRARIRARLWSVARSSNPEL